jgi:hypothetical protein
VRAPSWEEFNSGILRTLCDDGSFHALTVFVHYRYTRSLIKSQYTRYSRKVSIMEAQSYSPISRGEEKISKVIDRVLTQVFGTEATNLIYKHLEHKYSLRHDEVAERIDVFAKGLEEFLSSGAYVVERKILDDIYSSYGLLRRLELEKCEEDADFVGQIKSLMRRA